MSLDDADDHQVGLGRIGPAEDPPQRVAVRPVAAGHRLADDGHRLTVAPVAIVEGAASHDRHAGGVEEPAVHRRAVGAKRLPASGWHATVDREVGVAGRELERQWPDEADGRDPRQRPKALEQTPRALHGVVRC